MREGKREGERVKGREYKRMGGKTFRGGKSIRWRI